MNRSASSGSSLLSLAALLFGALSLAGCAGTMVGAGAAVGVAAYQERGVEGVANDLKTKAMVMDALLKHDHTLPTRVSTTVYEGRVLVTGVLDDENVRSDVVRTVWGVEGVKEVINEIHVAGGGLVNLAHDSWITTQLTSRLTFDKTVYAVNYSIETVNGTIFLIGIAQSQAELDRVIAHARELKYVRKVVSHVRVKGQGPA